MKTYGGRTFCLAAAELWNSLPQNIRTCEGVKNFKKLLKIFLLKQHFD